MRKIPIEKEYSSLRDELLSISERQFNSFTLAVTVTAAIVGYALQASTDRGLLALVPIMILSAIATQLESLAKAQMRIASYIRCFLEEENLDPIHWETFMTKFRRAPKTKLLINLNESWPTYEIVITILGIVCLVVAFLISKEMYEYITAVIFAVYWAAFAFWFRRNMRKPTKGELDIACETLRSDILG